MRLMPDQKSRDRTGKRAASGMELQGRKPYQSRQISKKCSICETRRIGHDEAVLVVWISVGGEQKSVVPTNGCITPDNSSPPLTWISGQPRQGPQPQTAWVVGCGPRKASDEKRYKPSGQLGRPVGQRAAFSPDSGVSTASPFPIVKW